MAVATTIPANPATARLNDLLRRAREVKQTSSIDPPLQVSALIEGDEGILGSLQGGKDAPDIESAAKSIFYSTLASIDISDPSFVTVWDLLDILQYCSNRDLCSQQLVLLLIEELLDGLSLTGCRYAFTFLESRRETLISPQSQNKNLVILRLCNELLRRLSRAEDPVFCGRVYIFLFQSFPLGDRSSVNLRGNFHVENVTTFEEYLGASTPVEDGMDVDAKEEVSEDAQVTEKDDVPAISETPTAKPPTMDINALYPVFWSLQNFFSDPPRLFDTENFKRFKDGLEATLAKFKEVPKVIQTVGTSLPTSAESPSDGGYDELASASNPKYLTSLDLFKLELSDLAFQRHILVQALIMIDFLLTLTEKSKSKPYYQAAQKAMQYPFTLNDEETEWALGIKVSIANYLQEGPDGKFYYRMVDTVLSRDKNWVRWKMANCKSFQRKKVPTKDYVDSKSGAQRAVSNKKGTKSRVSSDLHFLSNTDPQNALSQLRHDQKFVKPSPQFYANLIRTIDLDLDMADTEEEKRKLLDTKSSRTWRGLRLASQGQLKSFDNIEHGKGLEKLPPVTLSSEATGDENAPNASEDRDSVPQEQHPSVEEQRAGHQDQIMADSAE
ncbi:nuclear matrix protein [Periconia macrospinosa]|uniref:Nuclear matrix protein n=1 Tax=Periconia macrospinosa TaxID=97972 RepID=A0A2V1E7P6_9PLEO|nr:nuclear matrix protein [Periconia macrospinosa]